MIPFWSYCSDRGAYSLYCPWPFIHQTKSDSESGWRVWHYERLNGDVSVDMIPAITYDRKQDGFKKISFLWRFFRYERSTAGAKKLDLCFIPVAGHIPRLTISLHSDMAIT